ncbi:MAG: hypothetical protein EZS28_052144 [Streblomastix strix]|uniref:Uncharacterized protein n=1 Tax=Streblomastix strix TaxID=222440 RepID=A0A5J4SI58_9EUKA|nr:MAG: hypothetical protein EZS28_052144 [Streblomastix strix]
MRTQFTCEFHSHGGTDPNVIGLARQHILVPLLQNPPSVPVLFSPHKIGLPVEYQTEPLEDPLEPEIEVYPIVELVYAITQPLKDKVFPSTDIYKPRVTSLAQFATAIIKLLGAYTALVDGVYITHYPQIAPLFDDLLQPNSIDELPAFSNVLAILNPSSKPANAEGLIYTLPEVTLAYEVEVPAFKIYLVTNLELGYYVLKLLPRQLIYNGVPTGSVSVIIFEQNQGVI